MLQCENYVYTCHRGTAYLYAVPQDVAPLRTAYVTPSYYRKPVVMFQCENYVYTCHRGTAYRYAVPQDVAPLRTAYVTPSYYRKPVVMFQCEVMCTHVIVARHTCSKSSPVPFITCITMIDSMANVIKMVRCAYKKGFHGTLCLYLFHRSESSCSSLVAWPRSNTDYIFQEYNFRAAAATLQPPCLM
jgi:hypothetical protein